jgi:hypothetical protein
MLSPVAIVYISRAPDEGLRCLDSSTTATTSSNSENNTQKLNQAFNPQLATSAMAEAHDANRREVAVWQESADLIALANNKFNFQFAKSVLGKNGEITYNIIWQSRNLAPRLGISWEPIYALNWSASSHGCESVMARC